MKHNIRLDEDNGILAYLTIAVPAGIAVFMAVALSLIRIGVQ